MASILIHTADESVTLTAQTVKRLLDRGDGDAALLYLALLRHHGTVQPRSLAGELRWEKSRIEAAEQALRDLRLLAPAAEEIPEPADEKPSYQRDDIARRLESSEEFRLLTAEVEKKLGKRLTTPDVGVLLGLTDYLGLPADVIYLLLAGESLRGAGHPEVRRGAAAHPAADREGGLRLGQKGHRHPEGRSGVPEKVRGASGGHPAVYAGTGPWRPDAGGVGGKVSCGVAGDGLSAGDSGSGL